jgi:NTP pyrophosphatase (non-canonical NTP hydrolase)
MPRDPIDIDLVGEVLEDVMESVKHKVAVKGNGSFCSSHECLGILSEEQHELTDAVRSNDIGSIEKELNDIAVAAVWSLCSIRASALDWLDARFCLIGVEP